MSIPDELLQEKDVISVLTANESGVVIDQHNSTGADKTAAVGAYISHSIKGIEEKLGMLSLTSLSISGGQKNLLLSFEDDQIIAVESKPELSEQKILNILDENT